MKRRIHKRKSAIRIIIIALLVMLFPPQLTNAQISDESLKRVAEVYEYLSQYHLNEVDEETLVKGAINGMLEAMDDPYASYFTEEELQSFEEDINWNYVGIGILVAEVDGAFLIDRVLEDTPAQQAGILSGDIIQKVEKKQVEGLTMEEVQEMILGKEGTSVTLTLKRNEELVTKQIVREKVQVPVVESEMLFQDIGYIRLNTFSEDAAAKIEARLNRLQENGMERLVLDLRGNGGGYMGAAYDVATLFIEEGPVAYFKNRENTIEPIEIEDGHQWTKPMVVLIDENTASASEFLTGALQDYGKATVIGTTSYGKGVTQSAIPLQTGGYLKMTVEEYLTPAKRTVDQIGIEPDMVVSYPLDQIPSAIYTLTKESIFIPFSGVEWIQKQGQDFVAIRPVAQFLNGEVEWNHEDKNIQMTLEETSAVFRPTEEGGIWMEDGTTFIEVNRLIESFPFLKVEKNVDKKILILLLP